MRETTDTKVSPLWMLLPIGVELLALIEVAIVVATALSAVRAITSGGVYTPSLTGLLAGTAVMIMSFLILLLSLVFLYMIYLLIRRRNQHFARQQRFFADLEMALREVASKKGTSVEVYLGAMEATIRQAQMEETEKSAVLWTILLIVPFVDIIADLYIFYFLTVDFFKHERMEDGMLADASQALSALGVTFTFNRYDGIPQRSFVLYLILSIVTLGFFTFYWEYVLIQDPNNHFNNHIQFEDRLLQSVSPLLS
jgi:uncharacterized membrane protein